MLVSVLLLPTSCQMCSLPSPTQDTPNKHFCCSCSSVFATTDAFPEILGGNTCLWAVRHNKTRKLKCSYRSLIMNPQHPALAPPGKHHCRHISVEIMLWPFSEHSQNTWSACPRVRLSLLRPGTAAKWDWLNNLLDLLFQMRCTCMALKAELSHSTEGRSQEPAPPCPTHPPARQGGWIVPVPPKKSNMWAWFWFSFSLLLLLSCIACTLGTLRD